MKVWKKFGRRAAGTWGRLGHWKLKRAAWKATRKAAKHETQKQA